MQTYQLIGPFTQLLPLSNLPLKGSLKDHNLEVLKNAGILIKNGIINKIGKFEQLYKESKDLNPTITKLEGAHIGLPAFIDAHTHICFGGSRANDYAMRNSGKSYLEIAKAGGGIWDSVQQTRAASLEDLVAGIISRTERQKRNGITTTEVKSGYGLSIQEELKMLRAIQSANQQCDIDLIPTCLAAHIFPKDYEGTIEDYLKEMSDDLFPILKNENLSNRIDAFIEDAAFSQQLIASYFEAAKKMGFELTVHADQFHTGGSEVAIKYEALSADHLEASTNKEIEQLAKSEVIAVALPGASIGLGCDFTPARRLLDAGASLAIASDWNPGSAPMGDLLAQAAILGTFQKLSTAEVLPGITFRAAAALNLKDRAILKTGYLGDIIAFPTTDFQEILYHQGQLKVSKVWKSGRMIHAHNF